MYFDTKYCLYGKSTEDKPTPEENSAIFDNELVLYRELDTGKTLYFDVDDSLWKDYPFTNSI